MSDQTTTTEADSVQQSAAITTESLAADVADLADTLDGIMHAIGNLEARIATIESSKSSAAPVGNHAANGDALAARIARLEGKLKHF